MSFVELEPASEEEWLELRTKVLTATDMGTILGLNKWKSVAQLNEGKKNVEFFENSYTWLGQVLEPVVVQAVNKALGSDFKLYEDTSRSFFADLTIGLGATPDAYQGDVLLECKSTKPGNALRWNGWPPAYYLSQLYIQMICTDKQLGYLGVLSTNLTQQSEVLNLPLTIHKLKRDPKLDSIVFFEVARYWEACKINKLYRVNRKQVPYVEGLLRINSKKIYG